MWQLSLHVLSSFRKTNDSGNHVKFSEFARFLLDEKSRRREPLDRHWRPQWELCSPCDVAYDFIGHYETLYDDAAVVFSRIGIKSDLFPRDDVRWRRAAARLNETMSTLTKDTVDQLKQLYAGDFELFGYWLICVARKCSGWKCTTSYTRLTDRISSKFAQFNFISC